MSQIVPDRCAPQTYKYGGAAPDVGRLRPAHAAARSSTTAARPTPVGSTRCEGVDGWGALVASNGNLIKASAELNEVLFPHILRGRNYLTDSGGAGQWRGGCGSHFVKEVRTPTYVNQYVVNQRHVHPGIAGGRHGAPDHVVLAPGTAHETVVDPTVAAFLLETGEQLVYDFGGGGGWGDPLARDPQAVLDDVWDEYVSIEARRTRLRRRHHRLLEDMTLAVDEPATAHLRAEQAAAR